MNDESTVQDGMQRKWIYEEIVDRIPPFRWLPPIFDVIAQLLLVETVGVLAFIYFQMPIEDSLYSGVVGRLSIRYTMAAETQKSDEQTGAKGPPRIQVASVIE